MSTPVKNKVVYVRVGHRYVKTMGIFNAQEGRSFDCPVDVAWDSQGRFFVASRPDTFTRITFFHYEDDEFIGDFCKPGTKDGQLTWPGAIAVDRSDTLYISDQHTNRINLFKLDSELQFVGKWGEPGSGDGELKQPCGLAFDTEENLYVADTGNHRIQKFTKDGKFLLKWGSKGSGEGQFNLPWGIGLDQENNVYVADWQNDRIQKFTPEGEFLMSIGSSGSGDGQLLHPSGVAVDRGGDIYVADWGNSRVQIFDPRGVYQLKFTGDATVSKWGLENLMSNPDYLRERHRATMEPERQFNRPSSVKVDSEDRFFVVDTNRHRVVVYQKDTVTVDADWIDLDNPQRELQER